MRRQLLCLLSLPLLTFSSQEQQILMSNDPEYTPLTHSKPTLADLLTIEQSASIFYSYAREIELSTRFADESVQSTVFVPTNKAVMALARKPHEGPVTPSGEGIEISEQEFDDRSKKNVEKWISAHIIPESPIALDSQNHPTMLHGKSLVFTSISKNNGQGPEWSRMTLEDGIRIIGMREGLNGVLYLIDGTVSYT
ncbi:hypothetical protein Hypma_005636 [Hypsizygus marmoreus]|uniref:FAS1 domain-containing protein n=1 Tax=Hypsizygus marmoreus TaxID=39966 RepID=A0A369K6N0_HYPMA|nr:hypothetical protein Hypma_005636 [Hypsizygus marmoreus]